MKPILSFLRDTLTGGILFLLPIVLILMVIGKAFVILEKIASPISDKLPTIILGLNGSRLVAIALLILLCFLGGLLFRTQRVKGWISILEEHVLIYLPGYSLIKAVTVDAVGGVEEHNMKPAAIKDGDFWSLGFLVEEGERMSTVFIPEAPRPESGEIKMVPKELVKKLDVSTNIFNRSIKNYGKGAEAWFK